MELKDQCCNLEQARKLHELGITQESEFYFRGDNIWHFESVTDWPNQEQLSDLIHSGTESHLIFSAFTVAELGVMFPPNDGWHTIMSLPSGKWCCSSVYDEELAREGFITEAEARADLIISLLESGRITPAEVNQRLTQQ